MLKRCMVRVLVRLYPAAWRAEYGQEFRDVLLARPLGIGAVANVLWSAAREQLRGGEPWVLVGIPLALWVSVGFVLGAFCVMPFEAAPGAAWITRAIFVGAGAWTVLRRGTGGGRAAMKLNLVATFPLLAVGLLGTVGLLHISVFGPGERLAAFQNRGFAIAFSDPTGRLGAAGISRALLLLPVLQIPYAGLLGWIGELFARGFLRLRPRPVHV